MACSRSLRAAARDHMHTHDEGGALRFCPRCGDGLVPQVLKTGDPARLVCSACAFVLYMDPKVAVGTIIRLPDAEGRIVLVRRAIQPGYGLWVFPGGYVDRGEPLEVAARREAREECGLEVHLDGLVNVYSYRGRTPVVIVYAATKTGGALAHDDESLDVRGFRPDDIPWRALAFPSTHEALTDYLAGHVYPAGARAR
jgi:ADP-ribose pyrophosphatase YjhB (NUDIX family)